MNILAVAENERERREIAGFLEGRGHNVVTVRTMRDGLVAAARTNPDCIVLESSASAESRSQFQRVLSAGARHDQTPVLVANSSEPWQHVVDAISTLWEFEITRASLRSWTPPEVTTSALTALVLDESVRSAELSRSLADRHWRVLETSDVRRATLALLDLRVDCVLASSTIGGRPPFSVIRSLATLRQTHPSPFAILVLVDAESSTEKDEAVRSGADGIVARSLDGVNLSWKLNAAVTALRVRARDPKVAPPKGEDTLPDD